MPSRKSYPLEKKLDVVKRYHELDGNTSATAREFGISRRVIDRWVKQEVMLSHHGRRMKKRGNTNRKRRYLPRSSTCSYPDMEELLALWIREKRESGHAVHAKAICMEAKRILRELYAQDCPPFKASTGWLSRFLKRHKLVSRRVTTVGQAMPADAPKRASDFVAAVKSDINSKKYAKNCIGNMDESPFWFDMPSNQTYDLEGVKTVTSRTTGHEKLRFTVVLTAMSNGTKLKPMLIFKGLKNVPKGNFPKECSVTVAKGGSMTTDLMKTWMSTVWQTRPGSIFRTPGLLVMDRHASHVHESTKAALKTRHNTAVQLIPPGMTCVLQPVDVSWNKSMKSKVRAMWDEWLEQGEQEFTRTGKRKRARYDTVATWVVKAWQELPQEMIEASFVKCGISGDATEDDLHSSLQQLIRDGELPDDVSDAESETDDPSSDDSSDDGDDDDGGVIVSSEESGGDDDDAEDEGIIEIASDGDNGSSDNESCLEEASE